MSQADERAVLMDRIQAGRGILLSERERQRKSRNGLHKS